MTHSARHKSQYLNISLIALRDIYRLKALSCRGSWLAGRQPAHINTHTHTRTLLKSCRKAEADHIMQIAVACQDVRGIRTELEEWGEDGGEAGGEE